MSDTDEMPEFTITRTLDAPRDLVWRAWTDPEHLTHWFHPRGLVTPRETISVDLREGGRYRYTMLDETSGDEYPTGGVFLEVVPLERLVFTWGDPDPSVEDAPVATVVFTARDDRTEMVFHLRGVAGRPGDGDIYDGWDEALANLAAHLADDDPEGPSSTNR